MLFINDVGFSGLIFSDSRVGFQLLIKLTMIMMMMRRRRRRMTITTMMMTSTTTMMMTLMMMIKMIMIIMTLMFVILGIKTISYWPVYKGGNVRRRGYDVVSRDLPLCISCARSY